MIQTIADSGSTDLLIRANDIPQGTSIQKQSEFQVQLPNGNMIKSIGTTSIELPNSQVKLTAHIFDHTTLGTSLLSISQLSQQGCTTTFDNTSVIVRDQHGTIILRGTKAPHENLWRVPIPSPPSTASASPDLPSANLAIHNTTHAEYVKFTHATFGSPPTSALYKAVRNGWLHNFPRITAKMISRNDPNAIATAVGHLDRVRQGQYSTAASNTPPQPSLPLNMNDSSPNSEPYGTDETDRVSEDEYYDVYTKLVAAADINHSDLTGRFPTTSRRGNKYVLVSVWNGYVHMEPQASRADTEYLKAFTATITFIRRCGNQNIRIQRLDNETSTLLETYLHNAVESVQYLPPSNHRANKAERAIRDAKNHLISILATVHPDFPLAQWDELLEQAELTLNHLRPYRPNPTICAYEGLHRSKFDFLAHPIAPLGTKVLVHESPDTRGTWDPHGVAGFYIGPALTHHRAYRAFITVTQRIRISDTLAWFPEHFVMPGASPVELLHAAITDLTAALQTLATTHPGLAQSPTLAESTISATTSLRNIASLYSTTYRKPTHPAAAIVQPPAPLPIHETELALAERPAPAAEQRVPADATEPEQRVIGNNVAQEQRVIGNSSAQEQRTREAAPRELAPALDTHTHVLAAPTRDNAHWVRRSVRLNQPPAEAWAAQMAPDSPNTSYTDTDSARPPTIPLPPDLPSASVAKARPRQQRNRHRNRNPPYVNPWTAGKLGHANNANADTNPPVLNLDDTGNPLTFAKAVQGPDAASWRQAEIEEFIRLIEVTETMHAIMPHDQPAERKQDTTYYNPQCKEKIKDGVKTYRVRGTAGGDRINYPGDVSARTAEMDVVKILLQSTVSDHANWMTADIKDFYLMTPLERPEYIRIPLRQLPQAIIDRYSLQSFIHNDAILFQVNKGMYGLPQAGLLAQQRLEQHLGEHGYTQVPNVPCLYRHATNSVAFSLVVDDFGIKYKHRADAEHLLHVLRKLYEITADWEGSKYLGVTIKFDRQKHTVTLSMPGYIDKVIQRFCPTLTRGAPSPAIYTPPHYGASTQLADIDDTPPLTGAETKRVQEIIGCLLFYARAIDYTMLTAVNAIASQQSKATQRLLPDVDRLLAYAAAYPNNELVFAACDMILFIQSDASYLSRANARSVVGGIFYLGNAERPTNINGAVNAISNIIDVVVASAAEAEYAGAFINAQKGEWLRTVLAALGYPQPPTLLLCDNECAVGIANDTVKIKRSKSMDMRFHWLRDRIRQGHFIMQWRKGANNLADFFTKPLPVHQHQALMPLLVRTPIDPNNPVHSKRGRRAAAFKEQQIRARSKVH